MYLDLINKLFEFIQYNVSMRFHCDSKIGRKNSIIFFFKFYTKRRLRCSFAILIRLKYSILSFLHHHKQKKKQQKEKRNKKTNKPIPVIPVHSNYQFTFINYFIICHRWNEMTSIADDLHFQKRKKLSLFTYFDGEGVFLLFSLHGIYQFQ